MSGRIRPSKQLVWTWVMDELGHIPPGSLEMVCFYWAWQTVEKDKASVVVHVCLEGSALPPRPIQGFTSTAQLHEAPSRECYRHESLIVQTRGRTSFPG